MGRVGSFALVVFSVITFAGSILLPWIVRSPEPEKLGFTPRPPRRMAPLVNSIRKYKPDLLTVWMYSHFVFAGAMCLAPFVTSLRTATILVSICGVYVSPIHAYYFILILTPQTLGARLLGPFCIHWDRNQPSHSPQHYPCQWLLLPSPFQCHRHRLFPNILSSLPPS